MSGLWEGILGLFLRLMESRKIESVRQVQGLFKKPKEIKHAKPKLPNTLNYKSTKATKIKSQTAKFRLPELGTAQPQVVLLDLLVYC